MPKLSKNYIVIIVLSVISLILGGTFFAISQGGSKQGSAQNSPNSQNSSSVSNSSQSSPASQNSSSVFSSISSSNSQNSSSFSTSQNTNLNPKIQPLVVDSKYDVVVSNYCDLAMKFPKNQGLYQWVKAPEEYTEEQRKNMSGFGVPSLGYYIGEGSSRQLVSIICIKNIQWEEFLKNQEYTFNLSNYDKNLLTNLTSATLENIVEVKQAKYKTQGDGFNYFILTKNGLVYQQIIGGNGALPGVIFQINSLSPSSASISDKPQQTTQTYTNEYYPSLKINYDNSWKMETITSPVKYNPDRIGLLAREINLTKSGANLKINLYLEGGFGGGGDMEIQGTKIRENLYRYGPINNFEYDYISHSTTTNARSGPTYILSSSLKDLKNKPVNADVVILANLGNYNGDKNQILAEIDNILKNSSFGEPLR